MVKELAVNASLLISCFFVGNLLLTALRKRTFPIQLKPYLYSLGFGVMGVVLMIFSIHHSGTIIDFRLVAIALAAAYGGLLSSLLTSVMIGCFRVVLFGTSMMSALALESVLITGLICGLISRLVVNRVRQWFCLLLLVAISGSFSVAVELPNTRDMYTVIPVYWLGCIVTGSVAYVVSQYLRRSNRSLSQLEWNSRRDFLTDLNNARQFDLTINQMFSDSVDRQSEFSLLILDIDHFKRVNDQYGHQAGDAVLRDLARLLCDVIRVDDHVFRNGGEEFTVLLPECSREMSFDIAERIRAAVENHLFPLPGGRVLKVTISIGVATYPTMAADLGLLVERADQGLYLAKRAGRNKICVANEVVVG